MSLYRKEKIGDLVRDEVGKILHRELDLDFEALVTVTRVVISEDHNHARVYVSVFPLDVAKEVLENINRNIYFFQQTLNKKLQMRPVPKLFFVLDETEERAAKIEKLVEKVKN
ncbi:MAG: 30S ribosome-binding factor RbfA [Candidatus Yanofskybacteria bacterium]|nr:30S ribosome-binding factor RbfA [Candidatus Yanofskybacteria bacterium]